MILRVWDNCRWKRKLGEAKLIDICPPHRYCRLKVMAWVIGHGSNSVGGGLKRGPKSGLHQTAIRGQSFPGLP